MFDVSKTEFPVKYEYTQNIAVYTHIFLRSAAYISNTLIDTFRQESRLLFSQTSLFAFRCYNQSVPSHANYTAGVLPYGWQEMSSFPPPSAFSALPHIPGHPAEV